MWTDEAMAMLANYVDAPSRYRVTVAGLAGVVTAVALGDPDDLKMATFTTSESNGEPAGSLANYTPAHFVVSELRPKMHWWRQS